MSEQKGKIKPVALLLCDDVRKEISQKEIYIGVFTHGIAVTQTPAQLVLSVVFMFESVTPGDIDVVLEFRDPEGVPMGRVGAEIKITGVSKPMHTETMAVTGVPVRLTKGGDGAVFVRQNDGEWEKLRGFEIQVRSTLPGHDAIPRASSAPPPLAVQSPPSSS